MSGGGSQPTLRKYLGAIKDSTTVGLAKVNSDYKVRSYSLLIFFLSFSLYKMPLSWNFQELDIAVVKATNHVERPPKEKYLKGRLFS